VVIKAAVVRRAVDPAVGQVARVRVAPVDPVARAVLALPVRVLRGGPKARRWGARHLLMP
jgi:hypothetical protein